jgi:hypothetical protein
VAPKAKVEKERSQRCQDTHALPRQIKRSVDLKSLKQILAVTMKTFQITTLFALLASAMAFAPQVSQGE